MRRRELAAGTGRPRYDRDRAGTRAASLAVALLPAILLMLVFAGNSAAAVHWGFEGPSPSVDGWTQAGDPAQAGPGGSLRSPAEAVRLDLEGQGFLSSGETATPGTESGSLKGVWNSPEFRLRSPFVTLLIHAGGNPGSGAFVAVCVRDASLPRECRELARLDAPGDRRFRYRNLDLSGKTGQQVFIQMVDDSATRWLAIDNVRANSPLMPTDLVVSNGPRGPKLTWTPGPDALNGLVRSYRIERRAGAAGPWRAVAQPRCRAGVCPTGYLDRSARPDRAWFYRLAASDRAGTSEANVGYGRARASFGSRGRPVWRTGSNLTAIAFPAGGIGSSGVLHLGDGRRNESLIFNSYGRTLSRNGFMVPHSFFAVRARVPGRKPVLRALQTVPEGPFPAMAELAFNGEFPFARYRFRDPKLPVQVEESLYSPTIPGNMKDSAIPTAIYSFRLDNPGRHPVAVSLMASQQNAAGLDGESEVTGSNRRQNPGYGSNRNRIEGLPGRTRLELEGDAGSMALSMPGDAVTGTAAWDSEDDLLAALRDTGTITGPADAASPAAETTVDGALARKVTVPPGETRTVQVALSWNFPDRSRIFGGSGVQYANWWTDADAVDTYVFDHERRLAARTRRFHDTVYGSNLPRFVLDRLTGNIATLRSPSMFWAGNGFFGGWEGSGCCWNMPTHVWHYAQTQARLWPGIGRRFESQWLGQVTPEGLIPYRYGINEFAIDGQLGVILASYRDHLDSPDGTWLADHWPPIAKAMDYVIEQNDPDRNGVPDGQALTTLDFIQAVDGPWIGSLYLAALDAASRMAELEGDASHAAAYRQLLAAGRTAQASRYWRNGYFSAVPYPDPAVVSQANGLDIDMLLGQWWGSQLGLDPVYDTSRMKQALTRFYRENFLPVLTGSSPYSTYPIETWTPNLGSRVFADATDGGTMATTWPDGGEPRLRPLYWKELWSGREYTAAATMIEQGDVRQGLEMVKAVDDRYDGRLRNGPLIAANAPGRWLETCNTGEGTGNPFGDDECGNWYGRALSGWSLLLALQGFSYDGPAGRLGFAPRYRPDDHRSFFTAGDAWGSFSQYWQSPMRRFRATVRVGRGSLTLRQLDLGRVNRKAGRKVTVRLDGQRLSPARVVTGSGRISVRFAEPLVLDPGSVLTVTAGEG